MGVKIAADFPNMDKGTELDIGGVLVENGGSVELDDEQELAFVGRHHKSVKDWAGDSPYVKISGNPKHGTKAVEDMFPAPSFHFTANEELAEELESAPPAEPAASEGSSS